MTDPVAAAGLGLATASLALELVEGIVELYRVLTAAANMPDEYRYYQTRLLMEYNNLIAFRKAAGLIQRENDDLPGSLQSSKLVLVAILTEMRVLMSGFQDMTQKYSKVDADVTEKAKAKMKETENLATEFEALSYLEPAEAKIHSSKNPFQRRFWSQTRVSVVKAAHVTQSVVMHPDRFTWALFSAEEFLKRLTRLAELNAYLSGLLHGRDARRLEECTQRSQLDIVMIKNTVENLERLILASALIREPSSSSAIGREARERNSKLLASLTKSKQLRLEGDPDSPEDTGPSRGNPVPAPRLRYAQILGIDRPVSIAEDGSKTRSKGMLKLDTGETTNIWVEWRSYKTTWDEGLKFHVPRDDQTKRIKLLVSLLSSEKVEELCLPLCLGYFDDQGEAGDRHHDNPAQFGLVFERPTENAVPSSLYSMLHDGLEQHMPSLTDRVALACKIATCILFLHAISWLHHDIRSDSIIFLDPKNISMPLLSGFDYSRPDTNADQTASDPTESETPDETEAALAHRRLLNLARHPAYQGSRKPPYRKSFDVYGLGIVLIEIVFWQRIEDIETVEYPSGDRDEEVKKAQNLKEELEQPNSKTMGPIKTGFGEKYHGAILNCIRGPSAFGIEGDADEMDIFVGTKFQRGFIDLVVNALAEIRT